MLCTSVDYRQIAKRTDVQYYEWYVPSAMDVRGPMQSCQLMQICWSFSIDRLMGMSGESADESFDGNAAA